jgi:hypothetical protein
MSRIYKHFKGSLYEYICTAKYINNLDIYFVIYRDEKGQHWAREAKEFHGVTEDGKKRFELIYSRT